VPASFDHMPRSIRNFAVARPWWPGPAHHRVRCRNLGHLREWQSPRENLSRVSEPNNTEYHTKASHTYLPGHNPKGIHIAGLGGVRRIIRIRQHPRTGQLRCAATRKSVSARPAVNCPSCGVGESEHIAEAGDAGDTVFVDQDVCL